MAASEAFEERLQFYIYFFRDGLKSQLLDFFLLDPGSWHFAWHYCYEVVIPPKKGIKGLSDKQGKEEKVKSDLNLREIKLTIISGFRICPAYVISGNDLLLLEK